MCCAGGGIANSTGWYDIGYLHEAVIPASQMTPSSKYYYSVGSTVRCRPLPCRAMPCRAVPCRAVPCRAVLCWVVQCSACMVTPTASSSIASCAVLALSTGVPVLVKPQQLTRAPMPAI